MTMVKIRILKLHSQRSLLIRGIGEALSNIYENFIRVILCMLHTTLGERVNEVEEIRFFETISRWTTYIPTYTVIQNRL